jgi:hypothetical protein
MTLKIIIGAFVALFLINALVAQKSEAIDNTAIDPRIHQIDQYFSDRNMPLEGYGELMVRVADEYGLDWALLPAIAVREQSGGKVLPYNCPGKTKNYNTFGWGSGRICFTSFDVAIETVGMKLGTLSYYKGKSTYAKLQTYNPPSVVPTYAEEVIAIMNAIKSQ